ncbi:MAG: 3-oxoacyl-ACP synthase [Acidobacteriota bacterium]|nr:3-oxoacyl-ACP synthase [Acidobacteriota bacterium]
MVETNDAWIVERTGIRERHIADASVATSDMAVAAAREALEKRGLSASELDAIIVCTVTPDMQFPSTACLVQDRLGRGVAGDSTLRRLFGFLYGITTAAHLVGCGTQGTVLVIGADTMSRIIDYTDRSTCILFGDAAGAFLVERAEEGEYSYIGHSHEIDGSGAASLCMPAGGSRLPASSETVAKRFHFVKQEGQQVFKSAVKKMHKLCDGLLQKTRLLAGGCEASNSTPGKQANYRRYGGAARSA